MLIHRCTFWIGTSSSVPIGVPGELYIGGEGLARGYLNRPDLTAERFIPNLFNTESGARLYRTGDIVRFGPDGNLEFLGRTDHQVKIRGHRIELGEIEAVLASHTAVRAAVASCEDDHGHKQIVVWVVLSPAEQPTVNELLGFLKQQLPKWMLPARIFCVNALPLNPSGKVDRTALVVPALPTAQEPQAPQGGDSVGLQLAAIWQLVLGVPSGPDESFFNLGGTSLMAVRLVAKVKKTFGIDLPLATLFQAPTWGELSAVIRAGGRCSPKDCLVPLQSEGSNPPLFLVHPAGGDALCYAGLASHLGPDQPVYALQEGSFGGRGFFASIEELATQYLRQIRAIHPHGPYYLGGHCFGGVVAFEMACRLVAEGEKVDLLALLDSYPPCQVPRCRISFAHAWSKIPVRISHHIDALKRPGWRSRLVYVGEHLRLNYLGERVEGLYRQWEARIKICALLRPARIALRSYRPHAYSGKVLVLDVADREESSYRDTLESWRGLVKGELVVRTVPGCHGTMLLEPNVAALAGELGAVIDETMVTVSQVRGNHFQLTAKTNADTAEHSDER